jgi:hypothetical protein
LPTKWRRISIICISILFLFAGRAFYLLGDAQAQVMGLVFFGLALNGLISAAIYVSDWFRDLDESMKIMAFVWVAPIAGAFVGFVSDDMRGATIGLVAAALITNAIAVPISVYLYLRDRRETREYEEEMRKYGKEP